MAALSVTGFSQWGDQYSHWYLKCQFVLGVVWGTALGRNPFAP